MEHKDKALDKGAHNICLFLYLFFPFERVCVFIRIYSNLMLLLGRYLIFLLNR